MDLYARDLAAVVTGGASGLGEATARHLASKGVKVAIFDRDADRGAAVAGVIDGLFLPVDVTDPDSLSRSFGAAREAHGQERILVACAGIAPAQKTVSKGAPHDAALFAKTINVNLVGTFLAASQSATGMITAAPMGEDRERGVLVLTSSVAGTEGQIGQAAYAASKAGVAGLALPMARDLAPFGVRCVAIAPGLFKTPMLEGLPQEVQDALGGVAPYPARLGDADEFARLVGAIVENPMLNGSTIRLDGAIRLPPK